MLNEQPMASKRLEALRHMAASVRKAMDTSYDDIQDRRILSLKREVAEIKSQLGK
jgi:hypothetical protein